MDPARAAGCHDRQLVRAFPARLDSREDAYLIHPVLRGLAVKIRAGQMLEVKQYHLT